MTAAVLADTLPRLDDGSEAGIAGWAVLLDCERTKNDASERQAVTIVMNDDGHLTIDREVTLLSTAPYHYVAAFSENGVMMFGKKTPQGHAGEEVRLTPSGVYV